VGCYSFLVLGSNTSSGTALVDIGVLVALLAVRLVARFFFCWPLSMVSYGPPWAHYLGGYQDRLLGGPLGLPGLRYTAPEGVEHKDNIGVVLG
jgi:hypothetical protein